MLLGQPQQPARVVRRVGHRLVHERRHSLFQTRTGQLEMIAAVPVAVGDKEQVHIVADLLGRVADDDILTEDPGQAFGGVAVLVPHAGKRKPIHRLHRHLRGVGVVGVEVEVCASGLPRVVRRLPRFERMLQAQRVVGSEQSGVVRAMGIAADQANADRVVHRLTGSIDRQMLRLGWIVFLIYNGCAE